IPGHGQSVWPKDLQYAFLQGLQAYWGSPYSTHTLGRSGIVQFIVHYLQGLGIGRKREQLASRMQVLRERMRNSVIDVQRAELAKMDPEFMSSGLIRPFAFPLCSSRGSAAQLRSLCLPAISTHSLGWKKSKTRVMRHRCLRYPGIHRTSLKTSRFFFFI
ncbi:hypothetical protein B0H14DRAFT_2675800, partial [Mycena olivaceomarginata]